MLLHAVGQPWLYLPLSILPRRIPPFVQLSVMLVHLVGCLSAEYGGGIEHPPLSKMRYFVLGLRDGLVKRHAYGQYHGHHLPGQLRRLIERHLRHSQLDLRSLFPPRPSCLPYQGVFSRLETRQGHLYHRQKDNIEQEGHKYATLVETLFYREPTRATRRR